MTGHLGDRITPLVDGQLGHDDRDRALAHLARCPECQAEVATQRLLKSRLAELAAPPLPSGLTANLLSMGARDCQARPPRPPAPRRAPVLAGAFVAQRPGPLRPARPAASAPRPPAGPPSSGRGPAPAPRCPAGSGPAGRRAAVAVGRARRHGRMRRTLVGSAAFMLLAVSGAALADGRGATRPPDPAAVPTVATAVPVKAPTASVPRPAPMIVPVSLLHAGRP